MSEIDEMLTKVKTRIDYRFYTNILNIVASNQDAYIDFMQFPVENGEVPTVRIYMTHEHLRQFNEVLQKHPFITGDEAKE